MRSVRVCSCKLKVLGENLVYKYILKYVCTAFWQHNARTARTARTCVHHPKDTHIMKFIAVLFGASALCASDAFVPVAPVTGRHSAVVSSRAASSIPPAQTRGGCDVVMLLGGGSKRGGAGGISKSVSSKIANVFRGSKVTKG